MRLQERKDGGLDQINMLGEVHFREPGKLVIADTAYIPIREKTSQFTLHNVIFHEIKHVIMRDPSLVG